MKILWVKAGKLLPVDTGGKIRSYNLLRGLQARGNAVTLLSYYTGERDKEYETAIQKCLPGAMTINAGAGDGSIARRGLDYMRRAMMASAPYAVTKFTEPQVKRAIEELLSGTGEQSFDVAVCDFLSASLNFPSNLKTPTILFQHNVESILWQRQAQHEASFALRQVFRVEAAKMKAYERATVRRFDHIIAVSEADRAAMSEMTDRRRITVVPTGVDVAKYRVKDDDAEHKKHVAPDESLSPLVLFLGSMDWEANIDGVEYFAREIWESIREQVPTARFRVVGRNPHARIKRLASESIEVTGAVESVVEHLHRAQAFVVPLRIGGGTRLKIYEAMAAGRACISTTIGAEGLDVTNGENILLADEPREFAAAVVRVLQNTAERERLEKAAGDLAARYDWLHIAEDFEQVLAHAVKTQQDTGKSSDELSLNSVAAR